MKNIQDTCMISNSNKLEFKYELDSDEILIWSGSKNSANQEFYAFSNTRIFIKKYTRKEKYKLKILTIQEIPNIVLEEDYEVGTIKFGGSDSMRENALAWGAKATVIPKFEAIKDAKEVFKIILKLQYGVYDE